MDTKALPTDALAVAADLRDSAAHEIAKSKAAGHSEYPYLFGMATVLLAEANREILKLQLERARRRVGHSR